jgi:5-methylcytosine-specific restriction protein A
VNTYLLTWNPDNWSWDALADQASDTGRGQVVRERWSCGNTRRIVPRDRLFLLKQGRRPNKGIMATGTATSEVYEDRHWDEARAKRGETALYVEAAWDTILDTETELPLPVSAFEGGHLPAVHWATQKSGILIPPATAAHLEALWERHVGGIRGVGAVAPRSEGDDTEETEFPEGRVLYRLHRRRERSRELVRRARAEAMRRFGRLACAVCGFDFFEQYGEVGRDFIECHHTVPVSELRDGARTRLSDVALVCSNCHRMLHRRRPWLGIKELRVLLTGGRQRPVGSDSTGR